MIEIDVRWAIRAGACGNYKILGRDLFVSAFCFADFDRVRVDEAGVAGVDRDAVLLIEAAAHVFLLADDRLGAFAKLRKVELSRKTRLAEERAVVDLRHPENGGSKGFAWDGAPVGAATADAMELFDDGDFFAVFAGLHRGAFATRSGADDDHVVLITCHEAVLATGMNRRIYVIQRGRSGRQGRLPIASDEHLRLTAAARIRCGPSRWQGLLFRRSAPSRIWPSGDRASSATRNSDER